MAEKEKTTKSTESLTGGTVEKKASVKNGIWRMVFTLVSILFFVVVTLLLVRYAGSKAAWIYNTIRAVSMILVLGIYGSHKAGTIRMTWIILIMIEPIFGTTMYLLIGLNGHSLKMKRRYAEIDRKLMPLLPENRDVEEHVRNRDTRLYGLVRYLRDQAGYPVYENTSLTYYDDAEKGFEAQKKELAKAERFIFMEYHAIEDAECWHEILAVLEDRVRAGVEVRVFYDDLGSVGFINTDFVKRTEAKGIQCRVFNPFAPGLNLFLNNRDHRKITVIDGRVAFTGGYNLANEYFHRTEPYGFWKDTGIRLEGDAVDSLTVTFLEMWNAIKEHDKDDTDYVKYLSENLRKARLEAGKKEELKKEEPGKKGLSKEELSKEELSKKELSKNELSQDSAKTGAETVLPIASKCGAETVLPAASKSGAETFLPAASGKKADSRKVSAEKPPKGFVQPYADSPMDDVHVGEDLYISIAEGAREYVWYTTPYLIITDEMTHALSLAARRGVDVRIITPGIPDKKIIYGMTRSFYNGLTRNGVRIYEFTPGFCHAKMCISDDLVATCGTINLDYRSLYHHFENGCMYADCQTVMETKRDFESTFAQCREVTDYYTNGRGAMEGAKHMLLRLFSPLL